MTALGLEEHWIPDSEDDARCNIFVSDLSASNKLLVILQNQAGHTMIVLHEKVVRLGWLKTGSLEQIALSGEGIT